MEEAAIIEQLILFGLSRQEAAIYLCLLQNEELTGYEVAKLTGISRSNVYNGLASLVAWSCLCDRRNLLKISGCSIIRVLR